MTATGSSAAWLARHVRDVEAAGSNPAFPTKDAGQRLFFMPSCLHGLTCVSWAQRADLHV